MESDIPGQAVDQLADVAPELQAAKPGAEYEEIEPSAVAASSPFEDAGALDAPAVNASVTEPTGEIPAASDRQEAESAAAALHESGADERSVEGHADAEPGESDADAPSLTSRVSKEAPDVAGPSGCELTEAMSGGSMDAEGVSDAALAAAARSQADALQAATTEAAQQSQDVEAAVAAEEQQPPPTRETDAPPEAVPAASAHPSANPTDAVESDVPPVAGSGAETTAAAEGAHEGPPAAVAETRDEGIEASKAEGGAEQGGESAATGVSSPVAADTTPADADAVAAAPDVAAADGTPPQEGTADLDDTSSPAAVADGTADAAEDPSSTPAPPRDSYEAAEFSRALEESQIPHDACTLEGLVTLDSSRRNNVAYIEQGVLLTSSGNSVLIVDLASGHTTYVPGLGGGAIGAVAVHPSGKLFAVGEKSAVLGVAPNVYIYSYPSRKLIKVLRRGTERGYSALVFDQSGDKLATVGAMPDYTLTLWEWRSESIVLRAKAFSQEVYSVRFSSHFPGVLTTSGTGHIRFWKIASTFTGLKLQGDIGKFGKVELSDVVDWVEFPDAKVVSSSEAGDLLLWDGGLITAVLRRTGGRACHEGAINVVQLHVPTNRILTAGGDGWVRLWDARAINDAEPEEDTNVVELRPLEEVHLGGSLRSLVWEPDHWLVLEEATGLTKVTLPAAGESIADKHTREHLLAFNSGALIGAICSPRDAAVLTAGADGAARCYDYKTREQLFSRGLASGATTLCMAPGVLDEPFACRTAFIGCEDGALRTLLRYRDGFKLIAACKPHTAAITAVAASPTGGRLATTSRDGTVFLFRLTAAQPGGRPVTTEPLAVTTLPAVARKAAWTADGSTLLLACDGGRLLSMVVPSGDWDSSKTFCAEIAVEEVVFTPPPKPSKEPPPEEGAEGEGGDGDGASPAAAAGDGDAEAAAQPQGESAGGGTAEDTAPQEGEKEEEEEEEEDAAAPEITLLEADPQSADRYYVSFDGKLAGKVFKASIEYQMTIETHQGPPGPVTSFSINQHHTALMLGSANGSVRVLPLHKECGEALEGFWQAAVHDCTVGAVTGVTMSLDNGHLISAARDGTLAVHSVGLKVIPPPEVDRQALPMLESDEVPEVADIADSGAYSLEEAKQKAEADALAAAAEDKKRSVRELLDQIRTEFDALLAENDARPAAERLPPEAFEIDPDVRAMVEKETRLKKEIAAKELEWDRERAALALKKLHDKFLAGVEVERIVLHALKSRAQLTTFRTARMPEEMVEEIQAIKAAAVEAQAVAAKEAAAKGNAAAGEPSPVPGGDGQAARGAGAAAGVSGGGGAAGKAEAAKLGSDGKPLSKAEMRRAAREQRKRDWNAFYSTKPDDSYENEEDAAAIREAQQNIQDFNLKSDADYVVNEADRITATKKRRQILLLEDAVHSLKMGFNEKFLALRAVKEKVIQQIGQKNVAMRNFNAGLKLDEPLFEPRMELDEIPDRRLTQVTDEELAEFAKRKEEAAAAAAASSGGGGFGNFGGGASKPNDASDPKAAAAKKTAVRSKAAGEAETGEEVMARLLSMVPLSDAEKREAELNRVRLTHLKRKVQAEIDALISGFDGGLDALRLEKFKLEADLKAADIKRLVLYQELLLLQECEKKENVLNGKLEGKEADKAAVVASIQACSERLEERRSELEQIAVRKAAVTQDFNAAVDEGHQAREALSRIFQKKIKRLKKKRLGEDEEEEESDEELEDMDDDEDFDSDEDEEEVCPTGCDDKLYERVLEMRDRKLDEDDAVADIQKVVDVLKKDRESLRKKLRLIDTSLDAINCDITEFQKEKQGKLNEIEVVVTLHLHQIEYLVNRQLPTDLSQALVFKNSELDRLKDRIVELDEEKRMLRQKQKALRHEHMQQIKDKRVKESRVAELEARAYDVQMLKFGQVIDLELLDKVGPTKGANDLREAIREQEATQAAELAEWDRKIAARMEELGALTAENTACLSAVANLTRTQTGLEQQLASTQANLFVDPVAQRKKETVQRDRLVQVVNQQAKEIDTLKSQIAALYRKDTSIYR